MLLRINTRWQCSLFAFAYFTTNPEIASQLSLLTCINLFELPNDYLEATTWN